MSDWTAHSGPGCTAVASEEDVLRAVRTPTDHFTKDPSPEERQQITAGAVDTTYVAVVLSRVLAGPGEPLDVDVDTSEGRTVAELAAEQRSFLDELSRADDVGGEYVESPD